MYAGLSQFNAHRKFRMNTNNLIAIFHILRLHVTLNPRYFIYLDARLCAYKDKTYVYL